MDLALPLHVGHLRASVLCLDRRGLKERLIRGLWLTQARGREGYRMQGKPVAAEASMTLQQPEARHVFSLGSCPWITGPWHKLSGGEVWIVTCACTHRLLGGNSSSLSISCPSLVSVLIVTAHATLWSSFRWCSESPLLTQPETMVSCLLGSSRLFPGLPPSYLWHTNPLQAVFTQPTPVLSLGSDL